MIEIVPCTTIRQWMGYSMPTKCHVMIVVGLPGSGKTSFLKDTFGERYSTNCFDDFHSEACRDNSAFEYSRCFGALMQRMQAGEKCAISDVAFCEAERLKAAKVGLEKIAHNFGLQLEIEEVNFANDPNACRHNVIHRFGSEGVQNYIEELRMIDRFSNVYKCRDGSMPVKTCCKRL